MAKSCFPKNVNQPEMNIFNRFFYVYQRVLLSHRCSQTPASLRCLLNNAHVVADASYVEACRNVRLSVVDRGIFAGNSHGTTNILFGQELVIVPTIGDEIFPRVGSCETLGHLPTPVGH